MIDTSLFESSAEGVDELRQTYELTLKNRWRVSFPLVAQAHFLQRQQFRASAAARELAAEVYPALLQAFVQRHGAVVKETYASSLVAAVALTVDETIHLVYNLDAAVDPVAVELIFKCDALYREVQRLTWGKYQATSAHLLYSIEAQLIALIDEQKKQGAKHIDARQLAMLRREYKRAFVDWEVKAANTGNFQYLLGMLAGVLGVMVAIPLIGLGLQLTPLQGSSLVPAFVGSSIAGGAGAVVSVLMRMSRPGVRLDYRSGLAAMFLQGMFRPLVGSLFGLAVFVLLAGGLLPISLPDSSKQVYFFSGVAFLAGFSERFAKGLVDRAGSSVSDESPEVPSAPATKKSEKQ